MPQISVKYPKTLYCYPSRQIPTSERELPYNNKAMSDNSCNLAIETSSRHGSISLGHDDQLLESADLGQQQRHAVHLLPTLDRLCQQHSITPNQISQIYVSIGPGSFTGLRVAVTIAKTLAQSINCRIVPVPTLDVVAQNAPTQHTNIAVCLDARSGKTFTAIYQRTNNHWLKILEPKLLTPQQLLEIAPRPLAIIADQLPPFDWPDDINILDQHLAIPHSHVVWQLGRNLAANNQFADPIQLVPHYVRLPEAEEVLRTKNNNTNLAQPQPTPNN